MFISNNLTQLSKENSVFTQESTEIKAAHKLWLAVAFGSLPTALLTLVHFGII